MPRFRLLIELETIVKATNLVLIVMLYSSINKSHVLQGKVVDFLDVEIPIRCACGIMTGCTAGILHIHEAPISTDQIHCNAVTHKRSLPNPQVVLTCWRKSDSDCLCTHIQSLSLHSGIIPAVWSLQNNSHTRTQRSRSFCDRLIRSARSYRCNKGPQKPFPDVKACLLLRDRAYTFNFALADVFNGEDVCTKLWSNASNEGRCNNPPTADSRTEKQFWQGSAGHGSQDRVGRRSCTHMSCTTSRTGALTSAKRWKPPVLKVVHDNKFPMLRAVFGKISRPQVLPSLCCSIWGVHAQTQRRPMQSTSQPTRFARNVESLQNFITWTLA